MEHKLLNISSRQRTSGTNSNFRLNLNNSEGLQACKSIILKSASIPNTVYNINEFNNIILLGTSGADFTDTVPVGQYTINELITYLTTALTAYTPTITFDSKTSKLRFQTTTPLEYKIFSDGNTIADVLGITVASSGLVTDFTPASSISLEGLQNVFIASQTLGESNFISSLGLDKNFIGIIPITVPYGQIEHYTTNHADIDDFDSLSAQHGKNIQAIDVVLYDELGNIIDTNGHHIDLTFKIYY